MHEHEEDLPIIVLDEEEIREIIFIGLADKGIVMPQETTNKIAEVVFEYIFELFGFESVE